jgi:hypothetical protein
MRRVLLCLLLVGGCEKSGGVKMPLRFHPPTGAVYHQTLEQYTKVTMPLTGPLGGAGDQELRLRLFSTQTVRGPVAGGGTEIEIVVDSANLEMPSMSPDMSSQLTRLRGTRSTVVFDERSQTVRSDFSGLQGAPPQLANQMAAVLQGMAYAFPEQPVGPGDSWTVSMKLPLAQVGGANAARAGSALTKLTVREIRTDNADTTVIFDIKTTFPTGPIQLAVAGQNGTMRLSGELNGFQQFSISRGTIVDASVKGTSNVNITIASLGVRDMKITTQTESSIQLAGAGAK